MSAPSAVQTPSRPKMDTKTMVSIAMLTGIAYIVMLLSKLMPSVMLCLSRKCPRSRSLILQCRDSISTTIL